MAKEKFTGSKDLNGDGVVSIQEELEVAQAEVAGVEPVADVVVEEGQAVLVEEQPLVEEKPLVEEIVAQGLEEVNSITEVITETQELIEEAQKATNDAIEQAVAQAQVGIGATEAIAAVEPELKEAVKVFDEKGSKIAAKFPEVKVVDTATKPVIERPTQFVF